MPKPKAIEIEDKDVPLRDDIRSLGRILGDTVRERTGETVFGTVEHIRQPWVRFVPATVIGGDAHSTGRSTIRDAKEAPMKAMPIRDNRDGAGKTLPNPEDFTAIEAEHGPLPHEATVQRAAKRYRLAQARKLIRLWEQGKLPVELMREMDRIAAQGKGGRT